MTWDAHVNTICKKSAKSVNLLKRMNKQIDRKSKLMIYKSFIRPQLEYATQVFGSNLTLEQENKLEHIQRNAVLSITRAYIHTPHDKLLHEVGVEPLIIRRKYFRLCHLYKMVNNLVPRYLSSLVPSYVQEISPYGLRNSLNLRKPKTNKTYVLKSFLQQSIHDWNNQPIVTRQSPSYHIFKDNIKSTLFYKSQKLYNSRSGPGSVFHARLRMGLSGLNGHRHTFNFIPSSSCPSCGGKPESTTHFLLKCPTYDTIRGELLATIIAIISNSSIGQAAWLQLRTHGHCRTMTNILVCGSDSLTHEENNSIFDAVETYIVTTGRF